MIDMSEAYRTVESNDNNYKVLDFKCEYCGQEYGMETVNIAVFLYGVFFLVGKEGGYVGIICPRCMKTMVLKGQPDFVDSAKSSLTSYITIGDIQPPPGLRYHSSVNYSPKQNPALKGFDIPFWNTPLNEDDTESIEIRLSQYMHTEAWVAEEYLCSYVLDGKPPMGSFCSVWWFKDEQINELLKIENEKGVRVFPRYVYQNSLYEDVERFCRDNHLYLTYLQHQRDIAEANLEELKHVAQKQGMEFTDLLEANPDIAQPQVFRFLEKQFVDRIKDRDFRISSDLMMILAADPNLFEPSLPSDEPLEVLWRTESPFVGRKIPKTLVHFDPTPFKKSINRPSHHKMVEQVRANFKKEYIQELLSRMSSGFICNYVELAQRIDFSYAAVWDLKEKYLKRLYDSIKSRHKRRLIGRQISEDERREVQKIEKRFPAFKQIISQDHKINEMKIELSRLAQFKLKRPFLLWGETGTGKELFAKAIHEASGRSGRFVAVDCGTISENLIESQLFGHKKGAFTDAKDDRKGFFEQADNGTIFLDEMENLGPRLQARFLRVLQEREVQPLGSEQTTKVDVKIISGTNIDLGEEVERGNFRRDLYMRIKGLTYRIPPLRERKNDVPLLIQHFTEKEDDQRQAKPDLTPFGVTDECMDQLKKYEWPGNVRELEDLIGSIIVRRLAKKHRGEITPSDLPTELTETKKEIQEESGTEKRLPGNMKFTDEEIIACMAKHNNNKTHVAKELGVDPKTIRRRWKKLNP